MVKGAGCKVEFFEGVVGQVQVAVIENIQLDEFEDAEIAQFTVELLNGVDLAQQPFFIKPTTG